MREDSADDRDVNRARFAANYDDFGEDGEQKVNGGSNNGGVFHDPLALRAGGYDVRRQQQLALQRQPQPQQLRQPSMDDDELDGLDTSPAHVHQAQTHFSRGVGGVASQVMRGIIIDLYASESFIQLRSPGGAAGGGGGGGVMAEEAAAGEFVGSFSDEEEDEDELGVSNAGGGGRSKSVMR